MSLRDEAGADDADANLSSNGCSHQWFPDFSSRRSFSSSRSRLYLVGSSIVRDGGAIGFWIFPLKSPARTFFGLRCGMWLRGEADKAHLQAGHLAAGGAAREETIGGASRARSDARDIRRGQARAPELVAHDGAQVDEGLAGAAYINMLARAGNLAAETIAEIGVDFETTRTDRRAHRGANVGGASAQLVHRADAGGSDVGNHAAPSGVQCAGYLSFRIDHQYRHAVCGEYSEDHAGLGGDEAVARRAQSCGVASGGVDVVAMHLVQARDEIERRNLAAEAGPVGIDGALVVTDPVREIHRGESAGADAARSADEAVAKRVVVGPCAEDGYGADTR